MSMKTLHTEPFNSASSSAEKKETKGAPVKRVANASQMKSADPGEGSDILRTALAHRTPVLPSDNHIWTHTTRVEPVGANYTPMGEFGRVAQKGKGRGVYSYGGAPNKKGDNALGKALNKVGEKSGYPKGGKKAGGGGKRA